MPIAAPMTPIRTLCVNACATRRPRDAPSAVGERKLPASIVEANQQQPGDVDAECEKDEADAPGDRRHGPFFIGRDGVADKLFPHGFHAHGRTIHLMGNLGGEPERLVRRHVASKPDNHIRLY